MAIQSQHLRLKKYLTLSSTLTPTAFTEATFSSLIGVICEKHDYFTPRTSDILDLGPTQRNSLALTQLVPRGLVSVAIEGVSKQNTIAVMGIELGENRSMANDVPFGGRNATIGNTMQPTFPTKMGFVTEADTKQTRITKYRLEEGSTLKVAEIPVSFCIWKKKQ